MPEHLPAVLFNTHTTRKRQGLATQVPQPRLRCRVDAASTRDGNSALVTSQPMSQRHREAVARPT